MSFSIMYLGHSTTRISGEVIKETDPIPRLRAEEIPGLVGTREWASRPHNDRDDTRHTLTSFRASAFRIIS
jgi:hypothetical protein